MKKLFKRENVYKKLEKRSKNIKMKKRKKWFFEKMKVDVKVDIKGYGNIINNLKDKKSVFW